MNDRYSDPQLSAGWGSPIHPLIKLWKTVSHKRVDGVELQMHKSYLRSTKLTYFSRSEMLMHILVVHTNKALKLTKAGGQCEITQATWIVSVWDSISAGVGLTASDKLNAECVCIGLVCSVSPGGAPWCSRILGLRYTVDHNAAAWVVVVAFQSVYSLRCRSAPIQSITCVQRAPSRSLLCSWSIWVVDNCHDASQWQHYIHS